MRAHPGWITRTMRPFPAARAPLAWVTERAVPVSRANVAYSRFITFFLIQGSERPAWVPPHHQSARNVCPDVSACIQLKGSRELPANGDSSHLVRSIQGGARRSNTAPAAPGKWTAHERTVKPLRPIRYLPPADLTCFRWASRSLRTQSNRLFLC